MKKAVLLSFIIICEVVFGWFTRLAIPDANIVLLLNEEDKTLNSAYIYDNEIKNIEFTPTIQGGGYVYSVHKQQFL